MNLFAISGLLIGISSLSLGVFVYFKNRKSKLNQLFLLFAIAVAVWGFGGYKIGLTQDLFRAVFWWKVTHIGIIFIPIFLCHFIYTFLDIQKRTMLYLVYLFGFLFWYTILGPFGLALYYSVLEIIKVLEAKPNEAQTNLLKEAQLIRRVLDWVPVRLLGFAFALVGHFATVFKAWVNHLKTGINKEMPLLIEFAHAALQTKESPDVTEAINLIDRSLLVWLVVIALVSIGFWLG